MINRHNYEEFFLLYVDKELDTEGLAEVENFVSQNPDLAKELELLQQTTLVDDNIRFKQKEILYKKESSISLANYEQYFLLSVDKELNKQQSAEVENFVLKHPQLQKAYTLLQQTRLQPELITFTDKEKLYRKEKKVRRIIPLVLVRMGAAAAIVGVICVPFIVFHNSRSSNSNMVIATSEKSVKKAEKNDNPIIQSSVTQKPIDLSNTKKENKNTIKYMAVTSRKHEKNESAKSREKQIHEETVVLNKSENKREIPIAEQRIDIAQRDAWKPEIDETPLKVKNLFENKSSGLINNGKNNIMMSEAAEKEERPLFTHDVYLETENVEEEKSLYIGSAEINKNKLKGLFKKAAVFFDKKIRRNNNNDN